MNRTDLIHDWNVEGEDRAPHRPDIELDDETMRDGLQSSSVRTPSIDDKIEMLHLIAKLGIHAADLGLPGSSPAMRDDVIRLAKEIQVCGLPVSANCAARTLLVDIEPIVDASAVAGIPIEAAVFLGSSPIRQYAEDWSVDSLLSLTHEAVTFAVSHELPVMYVTEDSTRAQPETLRRLYTTAIECGARRICLADTVGHATPQGVWNLVRFIRSVVEDTGEDIKIDWHGHNDRGLGLINSLTAAFAGVHRIHGTALGIGERVGNTSIDQLLVNFKLLGWIETDLSSLGPYCDLVSRAVDVPIPTTYPVMGADAFRTATGVHAAAIIKAIRRNDPWLANHVYSGVPAEYFGREQVIEIGPMSGKSNVVYWLESRGIAPDAQLVDRIFEACKVTTSLLTEDQVMTMVNDHRSSGGLTAVSSGEGET